VLALLLTEKKASISAFSKIFLECPRIARTKERNIEEMLHDAVEHSLSDQVTLEREDQLGYSLSTSSSASNTKIYLMYFTETFWNVERRCGNRPDLILVQFLRRVKRSSNNPVKYYIRLPLVCSL
jgi:hypothetical protein